MLTRDIVITIGWPFSERPIAAHFLQTRERSQFPEKYIFFLEHPVCMYRGVYRHSRPLQPSRHQRALADDRRPHIQLRWPKDGEDHQELRYYTWINNDVNQNFWAIFLRRFFLWFWPSFCIFASFFGILCRILTGGRTKDAGRCCMCSLHNEGVREKVCYRDAPTFKKSLSSSLNTKLLLRSK